MVEAKEGDTVKVHFIGTLQDGTIFGSTNEDEPFEFTIGEKKVLPKFEDAVVGMNEGDSKAISISPEDAYGERNETLVMTVEKSDIPSHITPEVGKKIRVRLANGDMAILTVLDISKDKVTFDGNDPLAGKELSFEINLLEIVASKQ